MQETNKIVPHLWFDKKAKEAAEFYTSLFPNSKITNEITLHETPSGNANIVSFELWGQEFMSISAGPYFKFNPSLSFTVNVNPVEVPNAKEFIHNVWNKLSDGGEVLMPLQKYPYNELYGWIQDKYGLSWQLSLANKISEKRPPIVQSLLFVGDNCGRAEEAMEYYISVFKDSEKGYFARYPEGMEPDKEGTMMYSDFRLEDQWFIAMDSGHEHTFSFNEAVSYIVNCDTQEEIDYYWDKLSAVPEAEQCGWVKDQFGISWQVVPSNMNEIMSKCTPEQLDRVNKAVLKMKKLDIAEIQKAFEGK
ncbi:VOC family protein [Ureibacillus acetophenoni]|uniref:Predicted 3-demethylubiquinone-9 3-methyltransferase (Glyoxalase superfamily) n=1 Tax=Ureibacillus acetophenoni TaxID=614649 RepID=A0A285UQP4_9BACL|nr:VOC family protein [Ureibacillus acetophenoni]SOC44139.1 predicted 3-demethylubiquinone-9 3-methyltransferase (glyoxalase superfamily) [Ureibacillus acetophenoni]